MLGPILLEVHVSGEEITDQRTARDPEKATDPIECILPGDVVIITRLHIEDSGRKDQVVRTLDLLLRIDHVESRG